MVSNADRRRPRRGVHATAARLVALAGVIAAVLTVGIGTSGAAPATPAKGSAVGGTLTWAIAGNPASLFDAYYFSAEGSTLFSLVQDHILAPGTFGQPTTGEGSVSSSWKAVSPTRYEYTIKQGIKFSDGTPLRAADVASGSMLPQEEPTLAEDVTGGRGCG